MATRTNRVRTTTPIPPAPQVVPTLRPLGTSARVQAALDLNPGMSETDANIVALATELVQMKRLYAELIGKVEKLESAVTTLLKLSLTETPVKAKVQAPVTPVREVVEAPKATFVRMNEARRGTNTTAKAPKVEKLSFLGNARLMRVFDSFIETNIHFSQKHDAKLMATSSKWLLEAANAYLDGYQGSDTYLMSVQSRDASERTVPQLRGTLGKMLTFYKSSLARG